MIPFHNGDHHRKGYFFRLLGECVRSFLLLGITLILSVAGGAQVETASVSGVIYDQSGAIIVGAEVTVTNSDTNISSAGSSNQSGVYLVTSLKPGRYRIRVAKDGFKGIDLTDVILNVQSSVSRNFTLQVGSASETLSVDGTAMQINTQDATVSTVIDRQFVENMPLNGRSFQNLILLTPGVVTNTPQRPSSLGFAGEFSVNGQRTESNYYSVDGVSANLGASAVSSLTPASSGSLPASTSLGTTQGLVSVDALQEFRVQSSSYSAEYGRNPGGQFSLVTRSGANQWHGSAFDYFRNDVFDANDWFNNYLGLAKPPERQNDFGGTLGGPIEIPRIYDGKDKTFFFFSYEGLRLIQPQAAFTAVVPSVAARKSAATAVQPLVNAFPVPNCPAAATNCINDFGNGFGNFAGTWSNPNSIDSISARLDHAIGDRLKLFFRFGGTPSSSGSRDMNDPAAIITRELTTRTYTLGATEQFSSAFANDFRINYSSSQAANSSRVSTFGGAQPFDFAQLQGLNRSAYYLTTAVLYSSDLSNTSRLTQYRAQGLQRQWNIVDNVIASFGRLQLKFGVDYRRLTPLLQTQNPFVAYTFFGPNPLLTGTPTRALAQSTAPARPLFQNFSAFAQDEMRVTARWNVSLGLRWDVNPAPSASQGNPPYTLQGDINNPVTLTLAAPGTTLWHTSWYNFAPRLGMAYVLRNTAAWETVVRGGVGVFFDTGQQLGAYGYSGVGFSATANYCVACPAPATFPLTPAQTSPAIPSPPVAPYTAAAYGFAPHLQLPFTLQWNGSIEQALGKSQSLTITYVGANGRRLLQEHEIQDLSGLNSDFGTVIYIQNGLTSSYNALQAQFQRRLDHGFQVLASYTWSHSIDFGSQNIAQPYVRGSSDFDVRQSVSAALSYEVPNAFHNGFARAVLHHWGIDDRFTARTAFPVTLDGVSFIDPVTLQTYSSGLDTVPGQPLYLYSQQCDTFFGSKCPGGRAINPNAFTSPPFDPNTGLPTRPGDAPRNIAREFGAWQMDVAVRRDFPIHERLKLQFRAEAFNVFNHPSFGTVNADYCSLDPNSPSYSPGCRFGLASATLAQSLGVLSPLYQMGGPRSMQFALKLVF